MFDWPDFIRFASEATQVGLWAGGLLAISLLAFLGDRRRMKRTRIDAVGWMPWRDVSAYAAFLGFVLLVVAISGWTKG